jgi:hypothetical protein
MDYCSIIQEEISNIANYYNSNEVAYLALTAKVEATLRNKLAYRLQQRMIDEQTTLQVARDWQDTDIAIITSNGQAEALIYLKSGYIPDETDANESMIGFYPKKVLDAAQKANQIGFDHTKTYAVLFYTHQNKSVAEVYRKTVKHDNAFLRAFKKHTAEEMLSSAKKNITTFFENKNLKPIHITIEAGTCWDVKVEIHTWLVEL